MAKTAEIAAERLKAARTGSFEQHRVNSRPVSILSSTPLDDRRSRSLFEHEPSVVQQAVDSSNAYSRSLVALGPCTPSDDSGRISASDWNRWSRVFTRNSKNLSADDKLGLFERSAGDKLLDTIELLPGASQIGKSDCMSEIDEIFTMVDKFFNSETSTFAAQLEFDVITQNDKEGNLAFLERVAKKAKNCGFSTGEIDKKVMDAMALRARDKEIKNEAKRLNSDGRRYTFMQFRDIILNMERFQALEGNKIKESPGGQIGVCAVTGSENRSEYFPAGAQRFNGRQGPSNSRQLGFPRQKCAHCGGNHSPEGCSAKNKECFKCGRIGHLRHMCKAEKKPQQFKRTSTEYGPAISSKKFKPERVLNVDIPLEDQNDQVRLNDRVE